MKMKKLFATVLATALTVSTISSSVFASSSSAAWGTDGGTETQTGEGSVILPEIEVALPGDLSFEVDPLQLNTKAQILGGDYNIINYSNVDMAVTVKPTLVLESGLTAVSNNSLIDIDNTDPTNARYKTVSANNAKAVAAAFIVADKVTTDIPMNNDVYTFKYSGTTTLLGRSAFTYNDDGERKNSDIKLSKGTDNNSNACKLLDTSEATATTYTFLLDKYAPTGENDVYFDDNGNIKKEHAGIITSFTIVGAVDPHKSYSDGDIQLKAVYGMNVVTGYERTQAPYNGNISTSRQGFITP